MRHVWRTRTFVTDISRWEEIGRAHGEVFGEIRPASTMVEVRALIDPRMLVEVEADAIVDEEVGSRRTFPRHVIPRRREQGASGTAADSPLWSAARRAAFALLPPT